jgi:hypothetical protein
MSLQDLNRCRQAYARLTPGLRQAYARLTPGLRQAYARLTPVARLVVLGFHNLRHVGVQKSGGSSLVETEIRKPECQMRESLS